MTTSAASTAEPVPALAAPRAPASKYRNTPASKLAASGTLRTLHSAIALSGQLERPGSRGGGAVSRDSGRASRRATRYPATGSSTQRVHTIHAGSTSAADPSSAGIARDRRAICGSRRASPEGARRSQLDLVHAGEQQERLAPHLALAGEEHELVLALLGEHRARPAGFDRRAH